MTPARARTRPSRDQVRADLLAAAAAAFEARGYVATSLDAVAADAGYTKGAVYSNFGSKPELFAAACTARLEAHGADLLARVEPALASPDDRDALLADLSATITDWTLSAPTRWQALLSEFRAAAVRDEAVGRVYAELSAGRVAALAAMLGTNPYLAGLGPDGLRRAAAVLLNLIGALSLEHLAAPDSLDAETAAAVVRAFLQAMLP